MLRNALLLIFGMLLFVFSASAQEWGEISDEELAMIGIKEDPFADAVVLFDIGKLYITPQFETIFKRHIRIKILTEKGKDHADVRIAFWHEDKIHDLEAISYLPNGDEFELDEDNIFEEQHKKTKLKIFAIPGVEVGSIIEYRYELFSEYITYLEPWYFQSDEFTKLSELELNLPPGYNYNLFKSNVINQNLEYTESEAWNPYRSGKKVAKFKWKMMDIPAIKKEPYMFNTTDYMAKFSFQIATFVNQYNNYKFIKTWDDLAKNVREFYDNLLYKDDGVEELINQLSGEKGKKDFLKSAYSFVCNEIGNDSKPGFYTQDLETPEYVLEKNSGNPVEKNLLLISILKKAGYEVYPIIISTRSHGRFNPSIVNLRQFNHTSVLAKIGSEHFFMDTQNKYCPLGILPLDCSVPKGFIIKREGGQLTPITLPKIKSLNNIESNVILKSDGAIDVETNITCEGYVGIDNRIEINTSSKKEFIEKKINGLFNNAKIDTFSIANLDSIDKPLEISVKFNVPDYAQIVGELKYFSTPLFTQLQENFFTSVERNFPIDFPYILNESEIVKIQISEGWEINEVPAKTKGSCDKISYSYFCFKGNNSLEINRSFRQRTKSIRAHKYKDLKKLFDRIVEADQSQIVLKKI